MCVIVVHTLINISLSKYWHVWRNAKTAVCREQSQPCDLRYFTDAIGHDEDEFLERFFFMTARVEIDRVAGCKSQSETGN